MTYQLSKGVSFSHGSIAAPYAKVELKWSAVEKHVSAMIAQGRFYPRTTVPPCHSMRSTSLPGISARSSRTYPRNSRTPIRLAFDYWDAVKAIEPQLDNPARVEEIYQMMVPIWEATPQGDRMYKWRKTAFENLTAFRQGTFSRFLQSTRSLRPQPRPRPKPTTWAMATWETASPSGTGWRKNTGTTKQ